MMEDLLEKIRKIEALIQGAKTQGEMNAAILAKERINNRLSEQESKEEKEFTLYTQDNWHKKLLLAICRKYGLRPYRYKRQKYTTVMLKINEKYLNETIWKEYLEYSNILEALVEEVTDNIISKIHKDEEEDLIHGRIK